MGRYLGPRDKIERRIGEKLSLKGERSLGQKSALTRRPYPPGVHGKARAGKLSEFGQQLKSKQKIRNIYRLMEKQFKSYIKTALLTKKDPFKTILESLELRLDNLVFRAGLAQSRDQARQIVSHGHILVNGKRTNIPSRHIVLGESISVREQSRRSPYFTAVIAQWLKNYQPPEWLQVDKEALTATLKSYPGMLESGLKNEDLQAVVEYYSR